MVLLSLWKNHQEIQDKITIETEYLLKKCDPDEICEEVLETLNLIDTDTLFDRSGPSSHGYHDPSEMAMILIEEAIEPFQDQMNRYFEMQMQDKSMEYCKSILKALYTFDKEADSEFSEWTTDCAGEEFYSVLKNWNKKNSKKITKKKLNPL